MQTIHQLQHALERLESERNDCLQKVSHASEFIERIVAEHAQQRSRLDALTRELTESQQEVEELKIKLRGGVEYTALDHHTRHD